MKIKTKLRLNSLISVAVITMMIISLALSFWVYERADRNVNLVLKMRNIAFERITLRDDYLLHREERAKIQWQAKTEALRELMETADERLSTAEDKALLQDVRKDFDATRSGFSAILEKHKRENRRSDMRFTFDEAELRLTDQLFLKAYALMDSLERLRETTERSAKMARNTWAFMVIFFMVGGGMVIAINSTNLNKILTKRLATLTDGIKVIGDGNLDYQIVTEDNDELADLACASNKMAAKLKQSHTSVKDLEQEIAKRQRAEEKLEKTNRVLSVLSQINQMVIRTHEQDKLFADVCRITIEYGKFRMAWIGLIDEHEHIVKPISWDGFEEGYLTKIKKISTDDIPEGRGSVGTAIRNKKLFYCNDLANDPIMAPWRDDALQRGYRSVISLPLILQHRVIGALTIYDADPFFFNEAENNMLNDVTDNINYALEMMEIEKKRDQAEKEIKLLNEKLEGRVVERTAELSARTADLERINKVFVDRELRMRELKARIAELEKK
ncbi:MAG: multi-sensor signal transduction histidine kinase [Syntrophaceae bacterium]|nr:MAG: multi-sensor signal transduction histidine kinase [Syntrophaceae bacterium]